jgi:C1A family cysteine protease
MLTKFGYKRDPLVRVETDGSTTDLLKKDLRFGALTAQLPSGGTGDIDLSPYCTPSNQFELSSCVGNATADSVEILNSIAGYKPIQLSRLFVYAMSRIRNGDDKLEHDDGTYIRTAFDILSRFGVCDEYLWPYDTKLVGVSPSIKAQRQAVGHRIHAYYRIDSNGDQRIADILKALHAKHPVVFGTIVAEEFTQVRDRTPIQRPGPNAKILGGHAMIIVGYIGSAFLVKNSWGPNWGSHGFCLMSPEYITWSNTWDIWVPTLAIDFGAWPKQQAKK